MGLVRDHRVLLDCGGGTNSNYAPVLENATRLLTLLHAHIRQVQDGQIHHDHHWTNW